MNARQTHTVHRAYRSSGAFWITVKGHTRPYRTTEPLNEGDAVIVHGQTAERPINLNHG